MRKSKVFLMIAFLLLAVGFGSIAPEAGVKAAKLANVLTAPKADEGQWVLSPNGYRYRYAQSGKFAKKAWLNIDGNIYFFRANGYLQTGWKAYGGRRYYFDGQGVLVYGCWEKVDGGKYYLSKTTAGALLGKKKVGGSYYYFDTRTGKMLTGWQKVGKYYYYFDESTGKMAVNKKIGKYYVDAEGRRTAAVSGATQTGEAAEQEEDTVIFVGDSRTAGMCTYVHTNCSTCIKKVGEGYSWLVSTAVPKLSAQLKKTPAASVVFNLGVNDIANYSSYIAKYKQLMANYPKAKFYFMSINPIDKKYDTWGYFGSYKKMSGWIKTFNKQIKAAFPENYIDTFTYLKKEGFSTVDGLHYTAETYKKIYEFAMEKIG